MTEPTCTAQGYTTYTCSRTGCDHSYKDNYTDTAKHQYSGTITTAATCTTEGVKTFTCSNCDNTYTEAVAALEHDYKTSVTEPTCTAQGYTTYTCSRCKDSYTGNTTNAKDHNVINVPGKAATCTETGLTDGKKCSVCGTQTAAQTSIDALGHQYSVSSCNCNNGICSICNGITKISGQIPCTFNHGRCSCSDGRIKCDTCKGSGKVNQNDGRTFGGPANSYETCPTCSGAKFVTCAQCNGTTIKLDCGACDYGSIPTLVDCTACDSGKCSTCGGSGKITSNKCSVCGQ